LFFSSKIRKLLDCEDIVEFMVNAIPIFIKQNKLKEAIDSIILKVGEGIYAFGPSILVEINGTERELYFFELRPKELHYYLDAISGETNIRLNGDKEKIELLYKEICSQLNCFNWKTFCKTSSTFNVKYKV
jgi:hypothetical protein